MLVNHVISWQGEDRQRLLRSRCSITAIETLTNPGRMLRVTQELGVKTEVTKEPFDVGKGLSLAPFLGPLCHPSSPCLLPLSVRLVSHSEEVWGVGSGPMAAILSLGRSTRHTSPGQREAKEETSSSTIKETSLCNRGRPLQ